MLKADDVTVQTTYRLVLSPSRVHNLNAIRASVTM
jgi:hypothetical protein